jgi:predicted glycosyltransferase
MGLGHIRRNLLIAQALSTSRLQPNALLLSGSKRSENFQLPTGVDRIVIPSLYKGLDGTYRSRHLRLSLSEVISLRRKILRESIAAFDPDLVIVDGVPWGAVGELDCTLEYFTERGGCRCVLGMRDVWDEPAAIAKEWSQRRNWDAIRKYYDQIWIYGDPSVYDAVREYDFEPDVADKVRYTGYMHQKARLELVSDTAYDPHLSPRPPNGPFVLCLVGGGQDGGHLAEAFVEAELPQGTSGVVVTGPDMDPLVRERLLVKVRNKSWMKMYGFILEPTILLQQADCVVSMGGYNTLCEILSFRKRALVVPRIRPRREQLIRAKRMQRFGLVDILHPDNLEPEAITQFVQHNNGRPPSAIQPDMGGLARVLDLTESLLEKTGSHVIDPSVREP